ncbi:MAG: type IV toxin-antitoxin system AbiEi family antitoxin domain-containing protein [Eubacterium sp.]|jgi:hypothetical protein
MSEDKKNNKSVSEEKIKGFLNSHSGIIKTSDFEYAGIPRHYLADMLSENSIVCESHGYYYTSGSEPNIYEKLQARSKKIVFSYGTALYMNGLIDTAPRIIDVTVPQGTNVSRIKERYGKYVKFHYCIQSRYYVGTSSFYCGPFEGLRVYGKERCICDIVKKPETIEKDMFDEALRRYFGSEYYEERLHSLADILGVRDKIEHIEEIYKPNEKMEKNDKTR